jgi:hypothetical protein
MLAAFAAARSEVANGSCWLEVPQPIFHAAETSDAAARLSTLDRLVQIGLRKTPREAQETVLVAWWVHEAGGYVPVLMP